MSNIIRRRSIHAGKLERWLGAEKIDKIVADMHGWYGPPINLRDVPGSVWVTGDGDFVGDFGRGAFGSALDNLRDHLKQFWKRLEFERGFAEHAFGVGFTSISDALARASGGYSVPMPGVIKVGPTGVVNVASTLWALGSTPAAGTAAAAAPGGAAPNSSTTGAIPYSNPASGTLHLIGADFSATVANNTLMLYDRLFNVAKTMNSTAAEAITGVPTRYQNTTPGTADFAGGNFLFNEVVTALPATAHNWTTITYTDQGGAASTLPSLAGNASAIVHRMDMPVAHWFAPLEAGDIGIKALTQLQCSAAVATGAVTFVIGHPIGIMTFPVVTSMLPFDWLTNRQLAPRIFDDACLALLEMPKPATTTTTYVGQLQAVSAA